MKIALVVMGTLGLVGSTVSSAGAQPIVPFGNAPIITAPGQPSAIIRRFDNGTLLNIPGRSSTATGHAPGRPGTASQPPANEPVVSAPDQRPLVCKTLGYRTICE
jgi:hypothetical protein